MIAAFFRFMEAPRPGRGLAAGARLLSLTNRPAAILDPQLELPVALIHDFFVPGLAIASYIVADDATGSAAVIDPTRDVDSIVRFATENDLHIEHILETHIHADYVCGSRELKARLGGEPEVCCSGLGGDEWTPTYADRVIHDGDTVTIGSVRLAALHTPGHTPEHICWALYDEERSSDTPWVLFTGDCLFVGDVGRPDLLGEEAKQGLAGELHTTLFSRLKNVPDATEILPGHGAGSLCGKAINSRRSSTIGFERRFNRSLKEADKRDWIDGLMTDMPLAPPYFQRMKKVNREGPPVIGPELPGQKRWSASDVRQCMSDACLVLDVRSKESFASAHLPGSINIPFSPHLPTWAGWVLPYDLPTLLVLEDHTQMAEATRHLLRVGFEDLRGYLEGGIDAWQTCGYPLESLVTMSARDLRRQLSDSPDALTVLDVRTNAEFDGGHIDGALHVHGGQLQEQVGDVPQDRPVAVVCGSGYRASIAASFLKREGYDSVANVLGGMTAWNELEDRAA